MNDSDVKRKLAAQLKNSEIGGQKVTTWDHWRLYQDPELTRAVTDRLERKLAQLTQKPDFLCAVFESGLPLATILAQRLERPLLHLSFNQGLAVASRIGKGAHVVLIDSDLNSGRNLFLALSMLSPLKLQVDCLATVMLNDIFPADFTMPVKAQWTDTGKTHFLYRMSEL